MDCKVLSPDCIFSVQSVCLLRAWFERTKHSRMFPSMQTADPSSTPAWTLCIKQKVWVRAHPFPAGNYRYHCGSLKKCNEFSDVPYSQWCSFSVFLVQVITPTQLSSFSAAPFTNSAPLWPSSTIPLLFCISSRQRGWWYHFTHPYSHLSRPFCPLSMVLRVNTPQCKRFGSLISLLFHLLG